MKDISRLISKIIPCDTQLEQIAQRRLDSLTKPQGSLGRLEEIAKRLVIITGQEWPRLKKKVLFTFAGDHGVTQEGISAYPSEVTAQMVYNFLHGGAGINVLARHIGARVVIADLGVASDLKPRAGLIIKKIGYGTQNMVKGSAMTRDEAIKSIEAGIEIFSNEYDNGIDITGIGDMGIGNTTASSAITAVITGEPVEKVTGKGTGITDQMLDNKIQTIKKAIEINKPVPNDPLDVLAKVGGFEIGGLAGVVIAAAQRRVPVVTDGFIATAGAVIATEIEPKIKDYIIASHRSQEAGHQVLLDKIGQKPFLDLDLRLGEGTGAALEINLIEAALKLYTEMATFGEAHVSEKS
ncbi:MAG: nicotinate-nucleotide--dimethylbenzimidazole phosphoribosyltransferase [bacterium]